MVNILLTGATGLIGKDVLSVLIERGYDVYCLGRKHPEPVSEKIHFYSADFCAEFPERLLKTIPSIDTVVHMAAHIGGHDPKDDEVRYQKINIEFTERLLRYCQGGVVSKFIFLSSFSLLKKPLHKSIDENHPVDPVTDYSRSKYQGEQLILKYAQGHFVPVIFRLSSPIPADYKDLPNTVVKKWIQNAMAKKSIEVFGTGGRTQDFIATGDVANAVLRAIESPKVSGIYNIASGQTLAMKRLAEIIAKHFNVPINFSGADPLENDRWNISIAKARRDFNFSVTLTPEEMIRKVLS
jgi:UDP-glucose 4-epimerase